MPLLVQFGAGNIGRGFIGALFARSGWRVVFADIDARRVAELNARRGYQVHEVVDASRTTIPVSGVEGILASDQAAVASLVAQADLVATAVSVAALPQVGVVLARAWRLRQAQGGRPLDVLICENGAQASDVLRQAVRAQLRADEQPRLAATLGLVRTSIGRMIPPPAPGEDLLDASVEPYATLPVERAAFTGPIPAVPHLEAHADFDLVLAQKLYLHNLTHACLAYAGHQQGLQTIADCVRVPALALAARAAGDEAAQALALAFGTSPAQRDVLRQEHAELLDGLFIRYRNLALKDPVSRVARDPFRKLASDDRLVGAARICLAHGITPHAIIAHLLVACAYCPADDEPGAARWRDLQALSLLAPLAAASGLSEKDPLMTLTALAARRAAAASTIRAAGIVLNDQEAQVLEIADFGLKRFEEFGLAIHVYVNTERCCAKELVMVPGQICPEHRHPPIGGTEPGKEETFRVRNGHVSLFVPGPADAKMRDAALQLLPVDKRSAVTVYHRVDLAPGDQYTLQPNTPHWFAAGPQGAIVSEFSTRSRDEADIFTDHEIRRVPVPA